MPNGAARRSVIPDASVGSLTLETAPALGAEYRTEFAQLVRRQLELLGENPEREGLLNTPERVAKSPNAPRRVKSSLTPLRVFPKCRFALFQLDRNAIRGHLNGILGQYGSSRHGTASCRALSLPKSPSSW